jgi:hypothetical protein
MPKRSQSKPPANEPVRLPSVSTSAVFSFLKDTRGALTWKMRDFQECLSIGAKDAKQILAILQIQGYIQEKDHSDEYLTTASGEAVSGSKLPRMKRESVDEALSTIKERIAAINRDPRAKFSIRKAVALGDFRGKRAQVQAADVGVMLTRRTLVSANDDNDEEERTFLKQLQAKNRFQRYQPWMSDRTHRKLLYIGPPLFEKAQDFTCPSSHYRRVEDAVRVIGSWLRGNSVPFSPFEGVRNWIRSISLLSRWSTASLRRANK